MTQFTRFASLQTQRLLGTNSSDFQTKMAETEAILYQENEQYDIPIRLCQPYHEFNGRVEVCQHHLEYEVPPPLRLGFVTSLVLSQMEPIDYIQGNQVRRRVSIRSFSALTSITKVDFETMYYFNLYLCSEWFKVAEKNIPTASRPIMEYLQGNEQSPFRTYLFFVSDGHGIDWNEMNAFINQRQGLTQGACLFDKYLECKSKHLDFPLQAESQLSEYYQKHLFYSSTHRTIYSVFALINNIWQRNVPEFFDLIKTLSHNELTIPQIIQYFDLTQPEYAAMQYQKVAYFLFEYKFRTRVNSIETLRENMRRYESSPDFLTKKTKVRQLNNCPLAIVEYAQSIRSLQYYEALHFTTIPQVFREYGMRKDNFKIKKPHVALMPIIQLHQLYWTSDQMTVTCHLPMVMLEVEKQVVCMELRDHLTVPNCSLRHLGQAIQSCSYNPHSNYEVLETLGDSVLKFLTTLALYYSFTREENYLTHKRSECKIIFLSKKVVNNKFLGTLAVNAKLHVFAKQEQLKYPDWITPLFRGIELNKEAKIIAPHKQNFSLGQMADIYESILGAIFATDYKFDGVMKYLSITQNPLLTIRYPHLYGQFLLSPDHSEYAFESSYLDLVGPCLDLNDHQVKQIAFLRAAFPRQVLEIADITQTGFWKYGLNQNVLRWLLYFQEQILHYTFKNVYLLVEALCHLQLETMNGPIQNYQRLEFLGDAILECFIMGNVFDHFQRAKIKVNPHTMHKVKVLMLSNTFMGKLAALNGFHFFIINLHSMTEIDQFAFGCDFTLPYHQTQPTRTPKVLSDVWESICGALLIDGGWDAVSSIYGRFYRPFLNYVCAYVNRMEAPAYERLHHYAAQHKRELQTSVQHNDVNYDVQVSFDNVVIGRGSHADEKTARETAAIKACDYLKI